MWTWVLTRIIGPFKAYILAAGAAVAAVGYIYLKGRSAGTAAQKAKLERATKKIETQWHEVDRSDVDFDAALDGLRRKADRD